MFYAAPSNAFADGDSLVLSSSKPLLDRVVLQLDKETGKNQTRLENNKEYELEKTSDPRPS